MTNISQLSYYIQRALPLVFTDDMTQVEMMAAVVAKVNELTAAANVYFGSDVTTIITGILEAWKTDGTLDTIINAAIVPEIAENKAAQDLINAGFTADIALLTSASEATVINAVARGAFSDSATDNTELLQGIIDEAAGKAIVFIPKATGYYMVGNLVMQENTHLVIDGNLKLIAATNDHMITIPDGNSNIIIEGSGTLDGNGLQQTANTLAVIYCDDPQSEFITIRDIYIRNSKNWPINVSACHSKFEDCKFSDSPNMTFFGPGSDDVQIVGCEVWNINPDIGLGFYGGVTNGLIARNIAHHCTENGIAIHANTTQPAGSIDCSIVDNICYDNGMAGIGLSGGGSKNILVKGNICYGNSKGSNANSALEGGINIAGVSQATIEGNLIHENNSAGIILWDNVFNIDIINNTIYDEGLGIWFTYAVAVNVLIKGNHIFDTRDVPLMGPINFQSSSTLTDVKIIDNIIGAHGAGSDPIYWGPLHVELMQGNVGFNPQGYVAVDVPASGVGYTNDFSCPCDVYLLGGTVSAVTVGGHSIGIVAGHIRVHPDEEIVLTYSAAPTWQWFRD